VRDYGREQAEALRDQGPTPIDPRYYRWYSDDLGRMGVDKFERTVEDWEDDRPGRKRNE
jgi:hypothetical protein